MRCSAHDDHRPRPAPGTGEALSIDGELVAFLCPTGAENVRQLTALYRAHHGQPPWRLRQQYHPAERELARRCYIAEGNPAH